MKSLLLAFAVLAGVVSGRSGVLWDSISQPVGSDDPFSVTQWRAAAFRVTGSESLFLDSMTFELVGNVSGFVNVRLFSDVGNKPTSPLGRVSDIQLDATASGSFTVPSDTEFTLAPNTTYWVVTRMRPSTGSGFIRTHTDATESPINGSGVTFVGSQVSNNSGVAWQDWGGIPGMSISATVVPEPGTMSLIGCAVIALALKRKPRAHRV
jgi:hypothetical protein